MGRKTCGHKKKKTTQNTRSKKCFTQLQNITLPTNPTKNDRTQRFAELNKRVTKTITSFPSNRRKIKIGESILQNIALSNWTVNL